MDGKNVKITSLRSRFLSGEAIPFLYDKIALRQSFLITLLCILSSTAVGQQRQLIVLKNEEVLARYQNGDVIHFARAQDKEILVQRILDLNDTLLMMNFDSVVYYRIKKLDIRGRKQTSYAQKLGAYMIFAGVVLPLAELLNTGVIQNDEPSVSAGVWAASATLLAAGSALVFIKKPYFKPGRKYRLMIVDNRSPFYKVKPTTEGFVSPFIPKN